MNLHLNVISPEKTLYEGDVEEVTLPGTFAPFTILPRHAPIISSLAKGVVQFVPVDKTSVKEYEGNVKGGDKAFTDGSGKPGEAKEGSRWGIEINGGFIEMSDDVVTVCVT